MKYSRIVILIPRDKLWRFVDAERMDEFLELIFIKENEYSREEFNLLYSWPTAQFSPALTQLFHSTRSRGLIVLHLLATTKSPRALIPSNKRIISVASARITGRNESFLAYSFLFPFVPLFSLLPFYLESSPPSSFFSRLNQSAAIKWRSSAEIKGGNRERKGSDEKIAF